MLLPAGRNQYVIAETAQRRTLFERGNRRQSGRRQPVAANVDAAVIVHDARTSVYTGFIEQAAAGAVRGGCQAIVCLHRWDMLSEPAKRKLETGPLSEGWLSLPIMCTDAQGAGVAQLKQTLTGQTAVFIGTPGSGKTSLIRALAAEPQQAKAAPRTTATVLTALDSMYLIDTPGFKELHLGPLTGEETAALFGDIVPLTQHCRFSDCTHRTEPDCAVIAALQRGDIVKERVQLMHALSHGKTHAPDPEGSRTGQRRPEQQQQNFTCCRCGLAVTAENAGSRHRNHCPQCLTSLHVDERPGDRAAICRGAMEPISVWVRKGGEWAVIHRCHSCGELRSNRIAADDNPMLLLSLAVRPLSDPPFPLHQLETPAR